MAFLSVLAFCQPVFAADLGQGAAAPAPAPVASGWEATLTSYGWLTFLSGSTTVKGRTVDVDVDPIQVIDHLDRVPFMGYGELRKGLSPSMPTSSMPTSVFQAAAFIL